MGFHVKHGQDDSEQQGPELNVHLDEEHSLLATIFGTAIYHRGDAQDPKIVVLQNLN